MVKKQDPLVNRDIGDQISQVKPPVMTILNELN